MMLELEKAAAFAEDKHQGQFRKFGNEPYFDHPKRVAEILKELGSSDELIAAGYLHDTIEDTTTTYEELRNSFGSMVADLVQELTNDKKLLDAVGKTHYLIEKINRMSSEAFLIKLADRWDNVRDLKKADRDFRIRYARHTHELLEGLNREIKREHAKLLDRIRGELEGLL